MINIINYENTLNFGIQLRTSVGYVNGTWRDYQSRMLEISSFKVWEEDRGKGYGTELIHLFMIKILSDELIPKIITADCTRASFGIISKLQDKYPQIYWDIRLDESIVSVF